MQQAEGTPEVETMHVCLPGQGCSLLRRYSVPGGQASSASSG